MSVFDNVDFSSLICNRAEKNISDDWDRKYVTTRLEFLNALGQPVFAVRSSYSVDDKLQVILDDAVKISCDDFIRDHRQKLRSYGEHDMTESMRKDVEIIEILFESSPDDVKRVY